MEYKPRLKIKYIDEIVPSLTKQFTFSTPMRVPKLLKINVNQGVGEATQDKKLVPFNTGFLPM